MEKRKLENKAEQKPKNKSNKYTVIKEFCGIKKGTKLIIEDSHRAEHMLNKGYVKK